MSLSDVIGLEFDTSCQFCSHESSYILTPDAIYWSIMAENLQTLTIELTSPVSMQPSLRKSQISARDVGFSS